MYNIASIKKFFLKEALKLTRRDNNIYVISDLESTRDQKNETWRNKDSLKAAGFMWDKDAAAWYISKDRLPQALKTIEQINKVAEFVEKFEDLPEFLESSRNSELSDKVSSYLSELIEKVDEAEASEEIARYLIFRQKITTRSANNSLLIWIQNRNATHVEGFNTWKNKFGRQVKKGAKAIYIYVPKIKSKVSDEDEIISTAESDRELDAAVKKKFVSGFIMRPVFDIADTEPIPGKEDLYVDVPQWHDPNTPNETADKLYDYVEKVAKDIGIRLTIDSSRRGEQGYSAGGHINLSSDVAGANRLSTMVHELAHELLHWDKPTAKFYIKEKLTREERELQAESITFIVLKHYDIPVKHSPIYLALWRANKEKFMLYADVITKTSQYIIDEIDRVASGQEFNPEISDYY